MIINSYYIKGQGVTFEEQLVSLFNVFEQKGTTVRLVFFGNPSNNDNYLSNLQLIKQSVNQNFGDEPPVFSYVAQPPLEGNHLVMEVFEIIPASGTKVFYRQIKDIPYVIVESPKAKKLLLGGVRADSLDLSVRKQSDVIFSKLEEILSFEKMPVSSIIRQWNYIEQIVKTADGHQNYQDFNESRTRFYNKTTWENSYPAATGVGTSCAGVMVDMEALHSIGPDLKIIPLNNSLQVPAHAYSSTVLSGDENDNTSQKTTPKFERAKLILSSKNGFIYISGTAAIRGESSLENTGIEEQIRITIENIEHLISKDTLAGTGIKSIDDAVLFSLRIYLKDEMFFDQAKKIINEKYNGLPAVFLKGDVCREELLVEIEGFALLDLETSPLT